MLVDAWLGQDTLNQRLLPCLRNLYVGHGFKVSFCAFPYLWLSPGFAAGTTTYAFCRRQVAFDPLPTSQACLETRASESANGTARDHGGWQLQ